MSVPALKEQKTQTIFGNMIRSLAHGEKSQTSRVIQEIMQLLLIPKNMATWGLEEQEVHMTEIFGNIILRIIPGRKSIVVILQPRALFLFNK